MTETYMDIKQIAEYLNMSECTIRTWAKDPEIPIYQIGKMYRAKASELDAWIKTVNGKKISNE